MLVALERRLEDVRLQRFEGPRGLFRENVPLPAYAADPPRRLRSKTTAGTGGKGQGPQPCVWVGSPEEHSLGRADLRRVVAGSALQTLGRYM